MLSEAQLKRVWEGMLAAETRANYFADLSNGYYRKQRLSTWFTLVFSSAAAFSILASLPQDATWIRPLFALAATGLSLYSIVMQNQKLAVDSADLHARWSRLGKLYETIWENVYADDAYLSLQSADDSAVDLSKSATGLKYDEKSMLKWERYVVEQHGFVLA